MRKPPAKNSSEVLRFQIIFFEKRRGEKSVYSNSKPLAHLMDDPQLYGIVRTVDDIAYGGLRNAAFHVQLILRHLSLSQQF
mgnify:CR=1 FL=1